MLIRICPSLFDDVMAEGRLGASWRELQNRRELIKAASSVVEPKTYYEYFPSQQDAGPRFPALRQDSPKDSDESLISPI
jgi:hypothetical protein